MKKAAYSALLFVLIGAAFLVGSWYKPQATVTAGTREMASDAAVTRSGHTQDMPGSSTSFSPGAMKISPEKQQLIGVQVSPVERTSGTRTLRLFGRVAPDEARVYKLNAGGEGFIREVSPVTTGSRVEKGQALASFSAPDFVTSIQVYILALNAADRVTDANNTAASNLRQRVEKLQNLGMSDLQIEEIRQTREIPAAIRIVAPADGIVLARNVSPGQKFERGAEWYRIAGLGRVWILADVFENEAHYLRPRVRAQVSLPHQRKTLPARVTEVLPQFDAATRTLKVRLEADNPGYVLRPEMFVDVELPITLPPTIAVPADAVIDSGLRKTVFVERGDGIFEARQVETGWRFGDSVEIVEGLAPGERIVTSGTFLLDSESRMKSASAGTTSGRGQAPPTGHDHAHGAHDHSADDHGAHDHGPHSPAGHEHAAHGGAGHAP
jgi:RND family efflux transporter MFP subunit